ncbi:MAG: sulfatase-like hydrolase/transferase [Acidobacteria bacterium]|nr:sulfatase-like hydrolase/transferase [Acidobacteriota bacterium]
MASLTRRTVLQFVLASPAAAQSAKPRPNILLLLGDNWAYPHASVYGDPVVKTPAFDRIAKEGVLFLHAYAPNPSCSPSRSLLLTGRETHRLGEAASLYGPLAAAVPTYTELLHKSGYHVGFTIKG